MHDCYSTTYPNATPFQAWRAGFREGVKMCLNKGARPTFTEFQNRYCYYQKQNPHNLRLMKSLGLSEEDSKIFVDEIMFPEI